MSRIGKFGQHFPAPGKFGPTEAVNPWAVRAEANALAAERQKSLAEIKVKTGFVSAGFALDHKRRLVAIFVKSAPKGKRFQTPTFQREVLN